VDGISVLREAISTIPIPAAPPRLSIEGAAVGLGFLDAALRLNHVRRLTERLTIEQHRIAQRITEVDISINMLTDSQLGAARMLQRLAGHNTVHPRFENDVGSTIWVPVARLSSTNVGPVEVHDASGNRLPRLTQYETSRLISSGLYKLLRGILVTHRDASDPSTDLGNFLYRVNEPRWLLQSAILTVLTEASKPQTTFRDTTNTDRLADAKADPFRRMALHILDEYSSLLKDYLRLFDLAVNDHVVVVALDSQVDEHLLTYESPLYVNKLDHWSARVGRLIRASRQGYFVQYRTDIPATLRSYHLVAEAAQGIDVSSIFLSSNADESAVTVLAQDLVVVADRLEATAQHNEGVGSNRVLEIELQVLLRQLSELLRRRRWEASAAHVLEPRDCLAASTELVKLGEKSESESRQDAGSSQLLVTNPKLTPACLRRSAEELITYQLGYDVAVETQPITSRAHAYWRRPPPGPVSSGRIQIRSGMLLRNTAETGTRMVVVYALAVAGLVYLIACFLTRSIWPYGRSKSDMYSFLPSREATVAVILLVLGFLYTRLSLPERRSVAAHLRTVPRVVAYVCIISTVTLAAAIAAGTVGSVTQLMFIAGVAVPTASTLLRAVIGPIQTGHAGILASLDVPLWLTSEQAGSVRRVTPDVIFSSIGDSS
jgi:hypothetical protein